MTPEILPCKKSHLAWVSQIIILLATVGLTVIGTLLLWDRNHAFDSIKAHQIILEQHTDAMSKLCNRIGGLEWRQEIDDKERWPQMKINTEKLHRIEQRLDDLDDPNPNGKVNGKRK